MPGGSQAAEPKTATAALSHSSSRKVVLLSVISKTMCLISNRFTLRACVVPCMRSRVNRPGGVNGNAIGRSRYMEEDGTLLTAGTYLMRQPTYFPVMYDL
eukprot:GHVU01007686.1.p3 GENE.GHVU01007686.1~~GHVU01007686.1.p3  ORF type:complete len:100 (-),score=1.59 GHVU01007686.1:1060-1359(-)